MKKRSVIPIINDDNNCFWYALNILLNPQNETLKDHRNAKTRAKRGKELCERAGWEWDRPVPLDAIFDIEKTLECSIWVMDLKRIPFLGAKVSLYQSFVFKSASEYPNRHYLMLDGENSHYNAIKDL